MTEKYIVARLYLKEIIPEIEINNLSKLSDETLLHITNTTTISPLLSKELERRGLICEQSIYERAVTLMHKLYLKSGIPYYDDCKMAIEGGTLLEVAKLSVDGYLDFAKLGYVATNIFPKPTCDLDAIINLYLYKITGSEFYENCTILKGLSTGMLQHLIPLQYELTDEIVKLEVINRDLDMDNKDINEIIIIKYSNLLRSLSKIFLLINNLSSKAKKELNHILHFVRKYAVIESRFTFYRFQYHLAILEAKVAAIKQTLAISAKVGKISGKLLNCLIVSRQLRVVTLPIIGKYYSYELQNGKLTYELTYSNRELVSMWTTYLMTRKQIDSEIFRKYRGKFMKIKGICDKMYN